MATNYNTKTVTDGLVLCLDAANPRSYPGTGTVWKDISGNGNDFNIVGADYISSNPKHFSLIDDQSDHILRSESDVVGGLDDFTFDIVMRIDAFSAALCTFISYATDTNNNELLFGRNTANRFTLWKGSVNMEVTIPDSVYNIGSFIHFSLCRIGDNVKIYINGIEVASETYFTGLVDTGGILMFGQEQDSRGGSFSTGQDFPGDVSSYRVYSKALTAEEVQQNFQAFRGRYGL